MFPRLTLSVKLEEVAAVLVDAALEGSDTQMIEYYDFGPRGKALLKESK